MKVNPVDLLLSIVIQGVLLGIVFAIALPVQRIVTKNAMIAADKTKAKFSKKEDKIEDDI